MTREESTIRQETNYNKEPNRNMYCVKKQNSAIRGKLETN